MSTPKRMNTPHRMNAVQSPSMFPHTITVYNVSVETDKATFEDTVVNHITVLDGVLLDASKAVNVRESGMENADAVNLYIPFGVKAYDAVTGEPKQFLPQIEFWRSEEKDKYWTLAISKKGSSGDGYTFFAKGIVLPPDGTPPEKVSQVVEAAFDHVYNITKIDEKDFGDLKHWEVGGV